MPIEVKPPITPGKGLTQYQKLLTIMCRDTTNKWFYPYDFMQSQLGQLFVGYKAPTRLNELEHDYPELFERQPEGKYIKRRINRSTVSQWFNGLSKDLKQVVAKELDYYPHIPGNKYGK